MDETKAKARKRFQVIDGNSDAPADPKWRQCVERSRRQQGRLVKAAVMGSRRPDVTASGEGEELYAELEVARLAGITGVEVRQWVDTFPFLEPIEGATMRVYRRRDLDRVLEIRRLLVTDGLSMLEVRRRLERRFRRSRPTAKSDPT